MVLNRKSADLIVDQVREIYDWIDTELKADPSAAGACSACGKCCDFGRFDHRLFVTPPELIYFQSALGSEKPKSMSQPHCPYNVDKKCSIYPHRFAGCRIFNCKADRNFQSLLSETVLRKFKALCEQFDVPWRYTDLAAALNMLSRQYLSTG